MNCPVCQNEFNPNTGRRQKRFCSDPCKVKFWNAFKKVGKNNQPEKKVAIEAERETVSEASNKATNPLTQKEAIPPMPIKEKGEDSFDFAARKNEWKKLYGS